MQKSVFATAIAAISDPTSSSVLTAPFIQEHPTLALERTTPRFKGVQIIIAQILIVCVDLAIGIQPFDILYCGQFM